jgi:hypothetical protein
MSAQDGKPTPRPDAERAAWLLHPVSAIGRLTIGSDQYEELRAEALALREDRDALRERVSSLAEIPCPGRRGTTMRCMPGDKCSFCRARDCLAKLGETGAEAHGGRR